MNKLSSEDSGFAIRMVQVARRELNFFADRADLATMHGQPRARRVRAFAAAALAASLLAASAAEAKPAASAAKGKPAFRTGFADFAFANSSHQWLEHTAEVGGKIVRINAYWRDIAPSRPQRATDPNDPAYDWGPLDSAVRAAESHGLDVMITAFNSPRWAQGQNRPTTAAFEVWKPDTAAFGEFGQALATRYAGGFDPDGAGAATALPEARYLQAWNEPNLSFFLAPQYEVLSALSPSIYRDLLNAFYDGAHLGNPDVQVLAAGTAPYGDPPGEGRMRPLAFWREVLCLQGQSRKPRATPCPAPAKFDIFTHHPINTEGDPSLSAVHPDDASTADLGEVTRLLRDAERLGTVSTSRSHPVWAAEFWIESNPPDPLHGVSLVEQARWIEESLYLMWKQGAEAAIYFQIVDSPFDPADPSKNLQSGIFFEDWQPKPAVTAFRFPFVTDRRSRRQVLAWGMAERSGAVRIERQKGSGWKTISRIKGLKEGEVFTKRLRFAGTGNLRATQGKSSSLTWRQE